MEIFVLQGYSNFWRSPKAIPSESLRQSLKITSRGKNSPEKQIEPRDVIFMPVLKGLFGGWSLKTTSENKNYC